MQRVSVAIVEEDGKILIAQREKHGPFQNMWEFPGGRIEPGETPEECVRREVFEELGITAEHVDFLCTSRYDYAHGAVELHAFRVRSGSGEPERRFYRTLQWVEPAELFHYSFPAANAPIIEKLALRY